MVAGTVFLCCVMVLAGKGDAAVFVFLAGMAIAAISDL